MNALTAASAAKAVRPPTIALGQVRRRATGRGNLRSREGAGFGAGPASEGSADSARTSVDGTRDACHD